MAKQIEWKDLPNRYGLFTKKSTTMVDLDTDGIIQYYRVNTKLNFVQEAIFNGERYFRTESAMLQGLNWAFKASAFVLPDNDVASLAPSKESSNKFSTHINSKTPNKKLPKKVLAAEKPKSEVVISEDKKQSIVSAFKRFFGRK